MSDIPDKDSAHSSSVFEKLAPLSVISNGSLDSSEGTTNYDLQFPRRFTNHTQRQLHSNNGFCDHALQDFSSVPESPGQHVSIISNSFLSAKT